MASWYRVLKARVVKWKLVHWVQRVAPCAVIKAVVSVATVTLPISLMPSRWMPG